MKKRIVAFYAALCLGLLSLFFSGCVVVNLTDFNAVAGEGVPEKFEIAVGDFNGLKVDGFWEIHYYGDSRNYITLEIQPNLFEYYTAEVINGELNIGTTRRIRHDPSLIPVLTIYTPELKHLNFGGAGSFIAFDPIRAESFTLDVSGAGTGSAELDVERLFVRMSGAGKLDLSGMTGTADYRLSGAGEINALSLESRETAISLSGASTIRVNSRDRLRIRASGAGSIFYSGSPDLDLNNSGAVRVRRVE